MTEFVPGRSWNRLRQALLPSKLDSRSHKFGLLYSNLRRYPSPTSHCHDPSRPHWHAPQHMSRLEATGVKQKSIANFHDACILYSFKLHVPMVPSNNVVNSSFYILPSCLTLPRLCISNFQFPIKYLSCHVIHQHRYKTATGTWGGRASDGCISPHSEESERCPGTREV